MKTKDLVGSIKAQLEVLKNHKNSNGEKLIDLGTEYSFDIIEYAVRELAEKANLFEIMDKNAENLKIQSDLFEPIDSIFSFEVVTMRHYSDYNPETGEGKVWIKGINDDYNALVNWAVNRQSKKE